MKEKIIEIRKLYSKMDLDNSDFLTFFDLEHLQAGILRLRPGDIDTQEPHSTDEVYFVLEGDGFIEIGNKSYAIKKDLFIYVPAKLNTGFTEIHKRYWYYIFSVVNLK